MKNFFSSKSIVLALCLCAMSAVAWAGVNPKPFVVPELKEWHGAEGYMTLSGKYVVNGRKAAAEVGEMFAADYGSLMGAQLTLKNGKPSTGDIVLVLKADKALGQEGYRISIGDVTTVSAATVKGLKWGTRTVLQMSEQNRSNGGALPKGNIVDTPEYGLRGFMMDCGRKFIPMDYLRSLVKTMAYYKMNTLQIHLNDNGFRQFFDNDWDKTQAAFRLECDTYP